MHKVVRWRWVPVLGLALALTLTPGCALVREWQTGEATLDRPPIGFTVDETIVNSEKGLVALIDYEGDDQTRYVEVHKDILTGEIKDVFRVRPSPAEATLRGANVVADVAGLVGLGPLAEGILGLATVAAGAGGASRVRRTLKERKEADSNA